MGQRFELTESERESIKKLYLSEQPQKEDKKFCHSGNVKTLEEIMGDDESEDYIDNVRLRKNGLGSIIDKLELLKTSRLHPKLSDKGEHLAHGIMTTLKGFKPYNYFDETKKECASAMDKIIELYKENEHGEELVKDIEKVYGMKHHSPRAKEFLKHTLGIVKGQ